MWTISAHFINFLSFSMALSVSGLVSDLKLLDLLHTWFFEIIHQCIRQLFFDGYCCYIFSSLDDWTAHFLSGKIPGYYYWHNFQVFSCHASIIVLLRWFSFCCNFLDSWFSYSMFFRIHHCYYRYRVLEYFGLLHCLSLALISSQFWALNFFKIQVYLGRQNCWLFSG